MSDSNLLTKAESPDGTTQSYPFDRHYLQFDPAGSLYSSTGTNIYKDTRGANSPIVASETIKGTLTAIAASGSGLYRTDYTRDQLGRVTQKTEAIQGQTDTYRYQYDTAGRLTDVLKNGANIGHYQYDANGNRMSATTAQGTVSATHDDQDRLLTYGTRSYAYTNPIKGSAYLKQSQLAVNVKA